MEMTKNAATFAIKANTTTHQLNKKGPRRQKNYGVISDITLLWEKLRPKDVSEKQRLAFIDLALKRVKGRILEVVQNPKASRVLQSCLQYGSDKNKSAILNEIHEQVATLSTSKYGKHLVVKLIQKSGKGDFSKILKALLPKCTRLLKHQYGSDVMNEVYCKSDEYQRHELTLICYGREFHSGLLGEWHKEFDLLKASGRDPSSLESVMSDMDPIKKATVLERLHGLVTAVIEKGLLVNRLVHRLILEFLKTAPAAQVEDLCISLVDTGDGLLKMVHTREGSAVAAAVIRYSTANRRKIALRGFRDYVKETACDEWGYVVLVMALRVVDDTRMLIKTIVSGLVENLEEIVRSRYGRCVVLDLLGLDRGWYLPKKVQGHLDPRSLAVKSGEEWRELGLSKKEGDARRKELLGEGDGSLGKALVDLCVSKTAELLKCRRAKDVVMEVAACRFLDTDSRDAVHKAVEKAFSDQSS